MLKHVIAQKENELKFAAEAKRIAGEKRESAKQEWITEAHQRFDECLDEIGFFEMGGEVTRRFTENRNSDRLNEPSFVSKIEIAVNGLSIEACSVYSMHYRKHENMWVPFGEGESHQGFSWRFSSSCGACSTPKQFEEEIAVLLIEHITLNHFRCA